MSKLQSVRGHLALRNSDAYHREMPLTLKKRYEEKIKSHRCFDMFSKLKKCSCLMEHCIDSDEKRKLISDLMFRITALKYSDGTKYERYILSQMNLRVKGNYSNSEVDKYSIPLVYSMDPTNVAGEQEIWICK
eukprot:scaffold5014_cov205-Skeletonema_menzelii.AAC.1